MARIISIVNQKGGVGKTTTAVNLATAIAAIDKNVLLIDLDPQGNATTGFGVDKKSVEYSMYDCMIEGCDINETVIKTNVDNLDLIPSDIELAGAEIELDRLEEKHFSLSRSLRQLESYYDVIFIDCPPSLGLITVNALVASTSILIPLQCEFYALEGLSHLLKTFQLIRGNFNSSLEIDGIILTMYDRRNKITQQIEDDVRDLLGEKVLKTIIPRNVRLSEAPSHGLPAIMYDMECPGSTAYIALAEEMIDMQLFDFLQIEDKRAA